jgi:molecular chaperone DnaJ
VFGAQIPVELKLPERCDDCDGSGAGEGTKPVSCSECGGSGQVRRVRQSVLGQMVSTSPCPRCGGLGEIITTPCSTCRGEGRVTVDKTYTVEVPAGVVSGSTLRLTRRGAAGPRGGSHGDLYVHLRVRSHERFRREDDDLVVEVPISIAQAALGTKVVLETLDGDEDLAIPPGTQPGHEFVLRGRGVPRLHGRGRGDLRAMVWVRTPTDLTRDETELLRKFAEGRGERVGDPGTSLFSKIKSAFS